MTTKSSRCRLCRNTARGKRSGWSFPLVQYGTVLLLGMLLSACGHLTVLHLVKDGNKVENGILYGPERYNETDAPARIDVQPVSNDLAPKVYFEIYAHNSGGLGAIYYFLQNCDLDGQNCETFETGCNPGNVTYDAKGHKVFPELIRFDRTVACGAVLGSDGTWQKQTAGHQMVLDFSKAKLPAIRLSVFVNRIGGVTMSTQTLYFNSGTIMNQWGGLGRSSR